MFGEEALLAKLALRFTPLGKWLKVNWKAVAIIVAVAASIFFAYRWYEGKISAAYKSGFSNAEQQYQARVEAANKIAQHDDHQMELMTTTFGGLAQQRTQDINLKVETPTQRIKDEVASDPRYRDCRVSDGVLTDLNSVRATVDAGIAASHPRTDRR